MRRIKPNACGYNEFTCTGLSSGLSVAFSLGKFVCTPIVAEADTGAIEFEAGIPVACTLDNYYNLPMKAPTMSVAAELFTNMSVNISQVASRLDALSCNVQNVEDFATLTDLFGYYGTKIVARNNILYDEHFRYDPLITTLPCFDNLSDKIIYPGIVEPVESGAFSVVAPLVNVSFTPYIYIANLYGKFKDLENFFSCIDPPDPELPFLRCNMEALMASMASFSDCDNIAITLLDGVPIAKNGEVGSCVYGLTNSAGTTTSIVNVNGTPLTVDLLIDGNPTIQAPFYIYLNVDPLCTMAWISTTPADNNIPIGGVKKISTEGASCLSDTSQEDAAQEEQNQNGNPESGTAEEAATEDERGFYEMYVIDQVNCPKTVVVPQLPDLSDFCEAFNIVEVSEGRYTIMGTGEVRINETPIFASGMNTTYTAPATIWLNFNITQNSISCYVSDNKDSIVAMKLADLRKIQGTGYSRYVVNQYLCEVDRQIIRFDDQGFVFYTGESPMPFKLYPYCKR